MNEGELDALIALVQEIDRGSIDTQGRVDGRSDGHQERWQVDGGRQ
jgi:hypothetical protein